MKLKISNPAETSRTFDPIQKARVDETVDSVFTKRPRVFDDLALVQEGKIPKISDLSTAHRSFTPIQRTQADAIFIDSSKTVDETVFTLFTKRARSSDDLALDQEGKIAKISDLSRDLSSFDLIQRRRSLDYLDLAMKGKKIEEMKRLAYLDLASKRDPTKKDFRASLAFTKSMDVIAVSGLQSSFSFYPSDSISPKTAQKTDKFFSKKRIELNTIYGFVKTTTGERIALLKQKNGWKKYRAISGTSNNALISDTEVLKLGKNLNSYEIEQKRLNIIYSRIGDSSRGIQKRVSHIGENPNLFQYSRESCRRSPIKYHKEYPYKCDLFELVKRGPLPRQERVKIYESLVTGSKIFIQNGIHHLDAKLENMGYLGEGVAEHFDFGGAFIEDKDQRDINLAGYALSSETLSQDWRNTKKLLQESDHIKTISFLEKVHIFQLGIAFFKLSAGEEPYLQSGDGLIGDLLPVEHLKELLASQQEPDDPKHRAMILKMLSEKAEDRPNIDEVVLAFQEAPVLPSLIELKRFKKNIFK